MIAALDYSLFGCLLTLSVMFPGMLSRVKMLLLAGYVVVRLAHLHILGRRIPLLYGAVIPVAFAVVGAAYCLLGLALDAPGALRVLKLHAAYPMLLGLLASTASRHEAVRMFQVLVAACVLTVLVLLGGIALLLAGYDVTSFFANSAASIGVVPGWAKLSFKTADSLNFIIPFVLSYIVIRWDRKIALLGSIVAILIVGEAIIAGRRTFWLLLGFTAIAPLLSGGRRATKLALMAVLLAAGAAAAITYAKLDLAVLTDYLKTGLDFSSASGDEGGLLRGEQLRALLTGFAERPIFGHGLGATAQVYGSLRSINTPEAYELTYAYYLFATGLVGSTFYAGGLLFLLRGLRRVARLDGETCRAQALLVGMTGFLLANGVDPWLSKFDFMYVLFVPYAYIVAFEVDRGRAKKSSTSAMEETREADARPVALVDARARPAT